MKFEKIILLVIAFFGLFMFLPRFSYADKVVCPKDVSKLPGGNINNLYLKCNGTTRYAGVCYKSSDVCPPIYDTQLLCSDNETCQRISNDNPCIKCVPKTSPTPTNSNTRISGTITIGTTGTVPSTMQVCISISGPRHIYAPCKDFDTRGSRSPQYSFSIDTLSSFNGQAAKDVHGSVEINGQKGSVTGGTIVFGKQGNDLDMSINLANTSACSASNCSACTIAADCWGVSNNACKWGAARCEANTSGSPGTRTCEEVDNKPLGPGVPLSDKTFHCKSKCTEGTEEDKTGQGALYTCTGTLKCCKDIAKYSQHYGSNIGNGTTPAPGGGTTAPGGDTKTSPNPGRPEAFPCEFHGGQASYIGSFCGSADGKTHNQFDQTKAQTKTFCTMTYIDAYKCIDGTEDYFPIAGNTTCAQPPWCPSAVPTSTPGQDAGCVAYQGQTCHPGDYSNKIYCCEPNKNLECTNPNSAFPNSYTCQYKGGVAFTPTPGASNNCSAANFGNWGVGCACPTGGGCGGTLGCYKEASGKVFPPDNPNGQFCATGRWCAQSQTDVANTAVCMSSTPYVSPSPTDSSGGGSGYQADCPNQNADGSQNACILGSACPVGYTRHSSTGTPGGTDGSKVCTEFEGGQPSVCCTRQPGSTNPTVTSAPTPTPTPLPRTFHPNGPWIPLSSVGACPAGLVGYWKGTFCDSDNAYYDVYCDAAGTPRRNVVTGITCQH